MAGSEILARPVRLTDEVTRIIAERIASGVLSPGQQMPSEKELGETFGVSRAVVREAISRLKHDGLIEVRQGVRAFVSANPGGQVFRLEAPGGVDLAALFDLRICTEARAAELAAAHRRSDDLRRMADALAGMKSPVLESDDKVSADAAFHAAIAAASANGYFARLVEFLGEALRAAIGTARRNSARLPGMSALVQTEHEAIFAAIERGEAAQAGQAMTVHLSNARDRLGLAEKTPAG
ncbi:FadR/GntR family transcriptional regulator [Telmatospirillum siberiense]|nr:GntR family transcriptional regulator [Telmatospirillum siberiense]